MAIFDAATVSSPEYYEFDTLTKTATEDTNRRIDSAWWTRWNANLEANEDSIRRLPFVSEYFNAWRGERCIVAGAGPSLSTNLGALEKAVSRGWRLIAVDRAFDTLKRAGILPDITISNDAAEQVADFFDADLLEPGDVFALCAISHPDVYEKLSGCERRVFACVNPFSAFWKYVAGKFPQGLCCLRPGFVVTFSAVDLAMWMGAETVLTIGNELSWQNLDEVDRCYWSHPLIQLQNGRVTINSFYKAARAFRFFPERHSEVRFVDCSGGIAQGWEQAAPEEALAADARALQTTMEVRS